MNTQLFRLITKYQHAVHEAVILLSRSGIKMPLSCDNWLNTDIPAHGELLGGIRYFKHGYGCKVNLPSGTVDFDFGRRVRSADLIHGGCSISLDQVLVSISSLTLTN